MNQYDLFLCLAAEILFALLLIYLSGVPRDKMIKTFFFSVSSIFTVVLFFFMGAPHYPGSNPGVMKIKRDLNLIAGINSTPPNIAVYIAGTIGVLSDHPHACFWANDVITVICPDKDSMASAVYASDGHVYIGGCIMDDGYYKACYWMDGNPTPKIIIPDGNFSGVNTITYANGTIYAAGQYQDPRDGNFRAFAWASDGSGLVTLESAELFANVSAIAVSNGKVYVAGYEGNVDKHKACYWVNGVQHPLPDDAEIKSIAVSGGDVYFGGYYRNSKGRQRPCYWININRIDLRANSEDEDAWVNAIAVADGHVYAGGCCPFGCYWKDGVLTTVGLNCYEVMAIHIFRGHLFCLGYAINSDDTRTYGYWVDQDPHSKLNLVLNGKEFNISSYYAAIHYKEQSSQCRPFIHFRVVGGNMSNKDDIYLEQVGKEIAAYLMKLFPEIEIRREDHKIMFLYHTQTFVVADRSMIQEASSGFHREEGPSPDGFMLAVRLNKKGHPIYQVIMPQILKKEYWSVFVNEYPINNSGFVVCLSYQYGDKTEAEIIANVIDIILRKAHIGSRNKGNRPVG